MNKQFDNKDIENNQLILRRLRFKARRGMLELDLIFQRYLANNFSRMLQSKHLISQFEKLMDLTDPDLWDIFILKSKNQNSALNDVIVDIINHENKPTEN
jgi:succinate dehydrogenase flavin-adding protein (antitoxin of CptAB toxin-antitoxin module)